MTMINEIDGLSSILSKLELDYLASKNQGGKNQRDGYSFELAYATYQFAKLLSRIRDGRVEDASDLWIALQVPSFVDDIVIGMNGVILWIEAKRGDVTWRTGEERRRIEDNFLAQMNADKKLGKRAGRGHIYSLVVSGEHRAKLLGDALPKTFGGRNVKVVSFSEGRPDQIDISANSVVATVLRKLLPENASRYRYDPENPSPLELEDLRACVNDILALVHQLPSGRINVMANLLPQVEAECRNVRLRTKLPKLAKDVSQTLKNVEGLTVVSSNGRVKYELDDGPEGTLSCILGTPSGDHFEQAVREANPKYLTEVLAIFRETSNG
ncbi:hypothetical protein E0H36_18475 [Rhizobium leguminosarum bv. viciae]|uniref:hypothetical protein n=1 Tax=Rhizobium leguminosarum TaxID=384 RepID=UPI00102F9747|nr:hypothetical protein [Rhizobium leguminosarum]MBY5485211.1 hypothetical protein [Rhizobium leguminosarum]TAY88142.1 hypothetical protein ELH83_10090 [Rhizobium leguminosarum]TBZ31229.1 hypothetical protein E0H36_18475 [Rhizobium leguminosarum bv. viciae]